MNATPRDPKLRRMALLLATVALSFAGGAVVEHYRGQQDEARPDNASRVEQRRDAKESAPVELGRQAARQDTLQDEAAKPGDGGTVDTRAENPAPADALPEAKPEHERLAAAPDPSFAPERTDAPGAAAPAEPPRAEAAISPDVPPANAPGGADYSGLRQAIELYRKGDLAGGDRAKAGLTDSAARTLSEWVAVRFGGFVGFDRIARFMRDNPDWPVTAALRRRAEEALFVEKKPAAVVRAFFAEQKPTSAVGKVALALALRSEGAGREAAALVRDAWRNDTFGREFEAKILDLFPGVLAEVDHRDRMERFLFKENWASALRAAGYASKDYVLLAKARIAVGQEAGNAQKAIDAVPPSLRYETSYLFAKAQHLRRKDKAEEAAKIVADVSRDPAILVDGDEWWVERRLIARKLLDKGDAKAAYAVARDHGAESTEKRIEADFHAGWIALRFLNEPATAARHFAEAAKIAERPISVARTAYWQGRAAEAAGAHDEARGFYERAAGYSITYYGQLARTKLGQAEVALRAPGSDGRAAFESSSAAQGLKKLYEAGMRDLAITLSSDLASRLADAAHLDALGHLVTDARDPRALLTVGKTAVQRGFPLDLHAFPTLGIPAFEPVGGRVEKAMVYAITRQESAFDPSAQSSAGARGLMQLMPDTARRTAKRFGVDFDLGRLLDPAYNAKLGAAHLGELMDDWKGSHILMFASYNAGGGNVSKWIKAYGDPRSPNVDPIDWVERIPFSETRNYVQRVMENLLVYRSRLGERSASAHPDEKALPQANPVP
ncbi:MAG TPA: lytic transglycosylase domain-containing protein [Beijerinckiaceae bacterium]|nr:lytic transglycosylase domain-containing protein [Beijerinckiaceae bacterium]